ncbi:Oidioi.mRNA.OKI2018_I69.PAR.g9121.t1.cds [Oikopleura dioica]|uniref:Oidioi.mRNA.OKI2018_I69.PAR.g9121.t1.cds n=1 Tax=Oikopleura dioica TaxID=34765 RepID=A0ABN7RMH8_OIKDI|nr:Oidioi.mRNA.OKI2018_I69.PAR.g9121.t1.cds [Oikopleura dioica]
MSEIKLETLGQLQTYLVLKRADLLCYYQGLVELGGDNVEYLAMLNDEDLSQVVEMLGMTGKPLHIQRMIKALNDWKMTPHSFQNELEYYNQVPSNSIPIRNPYKEIEHQIQQLCEDFCDEENEKVMEELRESREAEREKVKAQFGESYAKVQEFAIRKIINAKDDVAVLDQELLVQIGKSLVRIDPSYLSETNQTRILEDTQKLLLQFRESFRSNDDRTSASEEEE